MILLVAYDLHNPGRDYDKVEKLLKSATSWCHPQGSVWLIDTNLTPATWRDKLKESGDKNDEYFVIQQKENWASSNMDKDATDWLKSPSRNW